MHTSDQWTIVDTETTGLSQPVYAVEIAAQRMRGWEPDGPPFQVLLNHEVPIDPAAEAVHGYSRVHLRRHGQDPRTAHAAFRSYADDLPIVAYNLGFDWDRVLRPEYQRLGIHTAGTKGFCALTLARRLIQETPNHRLETLKHHFKLSEQRSHRGAADVEAVARLFQGVYRERLCHAGIVGFAAIAAFSILTPIHRCRMKIFSSQPV